MKRDGFLDDVISGRDVNDRDRWLLRGQLLFEPSDDLSFRLIGDYAKRDEECCAAPYFLPDDDYASTPRRLTRAVDRSRRIERGARAAIINDDPVRPRHRRLPRAAAIASRRQGLRPVGRGRSMISAAPS